MKTVLGKDFGSGDHHGNFQQSHLCEAYRFAAILRAEGPHWVDSLRTAATTSHQPVISRPMASLDALFTGLDRLEPQ